MSKEKSYDKNNMDRFFKDNLEDFRVKPEKDVWSKIEHDLDTIDARKKMLMQRRFYRSAIAILLLVFSIQSSYLLHQNTILSNSETEIESTALHKDSYKFLTNFSALINKLEFYNTQANNSSDIQHIAQFESLTNSFEADNSYSSMTKNTGESGSNQSYRPASSVSGTTEENQKISEAVNSEGTDFSNTESSMLTTSDLQLLGEQELNFDENFDFLASINKLVDNPFGLDLESENRRIRKLQNNAPAEYSKGLHFGVGIQSVRNSLNEISLPAVAESDYKYSFNSGTGLKYGFNFGYDFNSNFGVESGFFLNTLNYSLDATSKNWNYTDRNFRLDYLEIPLLFRYKMSGYSYALNQTHGVTFTAGILYKKLIGGIFEETKNIFNQSLFFQEHNYGLAGGVQYDIFIVNNLILGFNMRIDTYAPYSNRYLYNMNFSGGASLRYFIPAKK